MKKLILKTSILAVSLSLIIASCKKDSIAPTSAHLVAESEEAQVANVNDNNETSSSIDQAIDDINTELNSLTSTARLEELLSECGRKVTHERINNTTVKGDNLRMVKITYEGNCNALGRTRTGTVIITLTKGNKFSEKGAEYTISFSGYSMKDNSRTGNDTVTATLDGLQTVTNETGGYVFLVGRWKQPSTIIHKITGDMKITFFGGQTRTWSITRKVTYTRDSTSRLVTVTIEGFGSDGTNNDVAVKGVNRFGDSFTTRITNPIVGYSSCFWIPSQGERVHIVTPVSGGEPIVVTETISQGTGSAKCPSGYKIKFKNRKGTEKYREVKWSK